MLMVNFNSLDTATKMNQPVRPTNLPLEYRKRRSYRGSYSATTNLGKFDELLIVSFQMKIW